MRDVMKRTFFYIYIGKEEEEKKGMYVLHYTDIDKD
jgi:hypothetical protein